MFHDAGNTIVSHQYDESNMFLAASGQSIIVLNGKAGGTITHHYGVGIYVLSRMGSGAILDMNGILYFHLTDGITHDKLIFSEENSIVSIQMLDDSNKLITLLRIKNQGIAVVRDISIYSTGPL